MQTIGRRLIVPFSFVLCIILSRHSLLPVRGDVDRNWTKGITKLQVEDLDESSAGCAQLRELDFCQEERASEGERKTTMRVRYPNALGHANEAETKAYLKRYSVLTDDVNCGRALKPFLCSILTPVCSATGADDDPPVSLPPCQSTCTSALDGCRAVMANSVEWPLDWACNRFPVDGLCLDLALHPNPTPGPILVYEFRGARSSSSDVQSRGSLQPPPSSTSDEKHRYRLTAEQHPKSNSGGNRSLISFRMRQPAPPPPRSSASSPSAVHVASSSSVAREDVYPRLFKGWVDVQGLGIPRDYCRVLGSHPTERFLTCALNGSAASHAFVSKRGFDVGQPMTWFMRDMDGDAKDDYCRCVGIRLICMKAGPRGFYGGPLQPGSEYTFSIPDSSAFAISCRKRSETFPRMNLDVKRRREANG